MAFPPNPARTIKAVKRNNITGHPFSLLAYTSIELSNQSGLTIA